MEKRVTIDNAIISSPSHISTNFPELWAYFMDDERGHAGLKNFVLNKTPRN